MTAFKPYRYEGCMIYSPKNKTFLEGFATALAHYPKTEKKKLVGRTVKLGIINYLVLIADRDRIALTSTTNKARGTIFLIEV
jgi:hypothetical protein